MKAFLLFFTIFFVTTSAQAAEKLFIMTEEFAPYQFYDPEKSDQGITGISIEIVRELQKRVGNTDEIKVLPWNRALKLLGKKRNALLFSTARTPAREEQYKWIGPLAKLDMMFFKRKDNPITFSSLEDAKKVEKIGVTKNVATHEILMNQGFENLDVMQSGADEKNIRRLLKGRIDVWPTAYYAGIYSAKKQGVLDQIEVVPNVFVLSGHLYIAANKELDESIVAKWQAALDGMKKDGSLEAILSSYDR